MIMLTRSDEELIRLVVREAIRDELRDVETVIRRVIREEMFPDAQPATASADSSLYAAPGMEVR